MLRAFLRLNFVCILLIVGGVAAVVTATMMDKSRYTLVINTAFNGMMTPFAFVPICVTSNSGGDGGALFSHCLLIFAGFDD